MQEQDKPQEQIIVADHSDLTLENARLLEAEARRRREAETLREAAAALTLALELDQVLEGVLTHLARVINYDSACVFLQEGDYLRAVAGRGFPEPPTVVGHTFVIKESNFFRRMQQTHHPLVLADVRAEPDFQRWGEIDYIRGWMGVPLIVRGEVIGYVTVDSQHVAAYTEAEAALAQALAHHAAIAIHNAQLYDQARQEIAQRRQIEEELRQYQDHLEELVERRTAELQQANDLLKQEIAERTRAEMALSLTQFAVDQAADAVFWVGPEAQFSYANEAACRMLEYTRPELLALTFHTVAPHFPAEVWPSHWRTTRQRGSLTVESRYRTKTGRLFPVELTFNYLEFNGRAYNFIFARDITWRHWAVEALQDSEQRLADIINFLPDATFVIDQEGRIIAWNRAMEEITGVKAEAMLGKGDYEYSLPFYDAKRPLLIDLALQPDPEVEKRYASIERDRDNLIAELYVAQSRRRPDSGAYLWIKASPLYDAQGEIVGAIETIRDITERKQAIESLAETNRQLQALADRLQGELILARKIQESLLPPARPGWPYLDLVCYSAPAREVGGDFYAYHMFEPPAAAQESGGYNAAIAVGDVSGKGMPAALLMAVSLTALQSVVTQTLDPASLLIQLDRIIEPYTHATRQNCALCYAVITPQPEEEQNAVCLRVANAGCVYPLIRRAGGLTEWVETGGVPLGLGWQWGYPEASVKLKRGDLVILTSDGLVEATNEAGALFGFERLEQAVAGGPAVSAAAMLAHLQAEVAAFTGQTEASDDLTIVVLQL